MKQSPGAMVAGFYDVRWRETERENFRLDGSYLERGRDEAKPALENQPRTWIKGERKEGEKLFHSAEKKKILCWFLC